MPADEVISSVANPRVRSATALRRRRVRAQEGLSLLEGHDELALAVDAGVRPRQLFYCPEIMRDEARGVALVERLISAGASVVRVTRPVFDKLAYREGPDGFIAVVPAIDRELADLNLPQQPFLLIAEGVEKPGNLGAMLRTADAAGADAVVAANPVTDWGNPNVVRSSKGTVFSVPVATGSSEATIEWLRERGVRLLAATPDSDVLHTDVDLTGALAIAVGTERDGLTEELMAAAAHRVRIPMAGQVNSLNVATSAAILLYEAVRQRNSPSFSA